MHHPHHHYTLRRHQTLKLRTACTMSAIHRGPPKMLRRSPVTINCLDLYPFSRTTTGRPKPCRNSTILSTPVPGAVRTLAFHVSSKWSASQPSTRNATMKRSTILYKINDIQIPSTPTLAMPSAPLPHRSVPTTPTLRSPTCRETACSGLPDTTGQNENDDSGRLCKLTRDKTGTLRAHPTATGNTELLSIRLQPSQEPTL